MPLAPVAIFAFRRPEHVASLIESLRANPEFAETPFVAYCDGPRSAADEPAIAETRRVLRSAGIPNLRMVERERNLGLANSIIAGVTELCAEHGRVIVLEDDLVLAPTYLTFMNAALDRYAEEPKVYSVSGYTFPIEPPGEEDAFFLPFPNSLGWGTWARAWSRLATPEASHAALAGDRSGRNRFDIGGAYPYWAMLNDQLGGKIDSWAIRWYASVFLESGLTLYPSRSLVENIGFDGSGIHSGARTPLIYTARAQALLVRAFPSTLEVHPLAFRRARSMLLRETALRWRLLRAATSAVRRLLGVLRPR